MDKTTQIIKRCGCTVQEFFWRLYEAGWVPAIGWVCVWIILYRFFLTSMIERVEYWYTGVVPPPILRSPTTEITGFVLAVLGSKVVQVFGEHIGDRFRKNREKE